MSEYKKLIAGDLRGEGLKICLVASRFNELIVEKLIGGAVDALRRLGVSAEDITLVRTPGAFELPAVTRRAMASGRFDAVVSLGCIIRGGTPHFDYVASACTRGISQVALEGAERGVAIVLGVLTTNTIEQAVERAGTKAGNKGFDAAMAAIETCRVFGALPPTERGA